VLVSAVVCCSSMKACAVVLRYDSVVHSVVPWCGAVLWPYGVMPLCVAIVWCQ